MEHNDYMQVKGKCLEFFADVAGSENSFLHLGQGSHHFVFYLDEVKERLAQRLTMKEITIPSDSVASENGYLNQAVTDWHGRYSPF